MPDRGKVLVAMSGGVDSSVAAALLLRDGYSIVGCFMRLGSPGETLDELVPDVGGCDPAKVKIGHQGCCSITDAADARAVAAELGVPFYVCNFKKDFGRVMDYFVDEYAQGRTPNPCVRCNDWLKFGKLHEYARQIGAGFVASGHYARVEDGRLMRGLDRGKDQSYVLFGLPRDQLSTTLLPIGAMHKAAVRERAKELGLPVFNKPDSQEICFVPDNDYAGLVERRRPDLAAPGPLMNAEGETIGEHAGQHRYTVGQRRGVGIATGHRLYVLDRNATTNTVTVGDPDALMVTACAAAEANWLLEPPGSDWVPCRAMYRSNGRLVEARIRSTPDLDEPTPSGRRGRFEVTFAEPQRAVAPGQAIVLYHHDNPDVVWGGGWIRTTTRA